MVTPCGKNFEADPMMTDMLPHSRVVRKYHSCKPIVQFDIHFRLTSITRQECEKDDVMSESCEKAY